MIKEIKINNFKSIRDLSILLGRFNIFIGSNGSGKSNILEAITFGGAASADKLDNEFLGSRGIRTTDALLMKCGFSKFLATKPIQLLFKNGDKPFLFTIDEEQGPVLKWIVKEKKTLEELMFDSYTSIFSGNVENLHEYDKLSDTEKNDLRNISNTFKNLITHESKDELNKFMREFITASIVNDAYKRNLYSDELANFIIYSPEITSLRKTEDDSVIKPLGIKGEGLFNILQIFYEKYDKETISKLKNYLHIIEWFDDFEAINDRVSGRKSLVIRDRYAHDILLNQNNVNEGFLFLMFYASLFLSNETPSFFAIDNIEASFHPRLCEELIKNLVALSQSKQVILTTHNPFILDGLNLNDPEQRLFVVRRNADGETIVDHIDKPPLNVKLSEAWMRGYIGGQPETF